ncbi:MAG TPA: thioredoxin [Gammaproteobacteria bacterium]|nr:thioredoxin [Gammaproteobacteria bacterium]
MAKKTNNLSLLLLLFSFSIYAATPPGLDDIDSDLIFEDRQLDDELTYPDWFKLPFGNLKDNLKEATDAGKKGIITYFGQKRCAYCAQFFKTSLADTEIQNYLRRHYDVIAFDIWGIDDIIDTDGKQYTEHELSIHYKTDFTPSLIFYDAGGTPVFRLRGYYPPYKFRAALQYVTEEFYKKETFAEYFERANTGDFFLLGGLTERDFFIPPPFDLPLLQKDKKPIAVFFEQGNCHTCDLLHSGPLEKDLSIHELEQMDVIQLNMWSETPVITPDGVKTTAREWAKSLDIFYAPSIVFFDPDGTEIIRVDSVTRFYRLLGVLDYVNKQGYKQVSDYQRWRLQQRKVSP